ncbi:hypothetical protein D3872_01160 [Massilia cavernae]|uniref:Uncharacterized protein n=1 Tax=Massilia cavernae TaxID=2320864 RepID=A0A418Y8F7_9BURK|nr:hypothetical protein D3872_01160 [Massilia cavernae]
MRPAWAYSCGCKSRRKLTTASEVKRNCGRLRRIGAGRTRHVYLQLAQPHGGDVAFHAGMAAAATSWKWEPMFASSTGSVSVSTKLRKSKAGVAALWPE